jgi:TonB family protein
MKQFIFVLLAIFPIVLWGQKTKQIIDKKTRETYNVLKSDKTIRHGEYKKFSYRNTVVVKGFYKSGIKDSVWECYDYDGQVILKYNYSKSELVFYKPDEPMKRAEYKIIGNMDSKANLSRVPIYLGGDYYILSEVLKNIRYPIKAQEYDKSGTVFVSFTVDRDGKTSNYHVNKKLGYNLDEEAIRVLKLIPDNWLPGMQNGQAVDVEVSCPIAFVLL